MVDDELAALVAAYWSHYRLVDGDRQERLRAQQFSWAWERVQEVVTGDSRALLVLDALLAAPGADPGYVGAGPVEDLLSEHGSRHESEVAERCRRSETWRQAVGSVWLDDASRRGLPALAPYLPSSD